MNTSSPSASRILELRRVCLHVVVGVIAAPLVGLGACTVGVDDVDDAALLSDEQPIAEFRAMPGPYPNRDQRALDKPIDEALANLACERGPDLDNVKNYDVGHHVQSLIYTGPFSDDTSRVWYARSDGDGEWEGDELRRNKASGGDMGWDGTIRANMSGDIPWEKNSDVDGEDHVSQLEWLPDYGSDSSYEAGYLFVAAENSEGVRIYYHHKDDSGDPDEVTDGSTRLGRNDGGKINQVYILHRNGYYWLAIGEASGFEVWVASEAELFPSGAGSLDPAAFEYHADISGVGANGANCYFVTDSEDDVYRLCYKNSSSDNCDTGPGNDNTINAQAVTIPNSPNSGSFSIASSVTYSANVGSWGSTSWVCETECRGMRLPSFRWSGTHYVDAEGHLNVYSLSAGGEDGLCMSAGSSDARIEFCSEEIRLRDLGNDHAANVVEFNQSMVNTLPSATRSSYAVIMGTVVVPAAIIGTQTLVEIGGSTTGINLTVSTGGVLTLHGTSGGTYHAYGMGIVPVNGVYSFAIEIDTVDDKIALYWGEGAQTGLNTRTDVVFEATLANGMWSGTDAIGLGEINGSAAGGVGGDFAGSFVDFTRIYEQIEF